MSAILSADDLNDFISPGVACIKPIETLPEAPSKPTAESTEVILDGSASAATAASDNAPAQISLTDCLACSGCVTSAEAVLVSMQSHAEVLSTLDAAPALRITEPDANGNTRIEGLENPESKLFVASVSPQTRANLAAACGKSTTERAAGAMLENLLRGADGLRRGGQWNNDFTWVVDTNTAREATLALSAHEVLSTTSDSAPPKPILASACPGWVCYAEKTHPYVLPHLSKVKSPQALTGTMLKSILSRRFGIPCSRIWHLAVMPCFDKKLEASREELTDEVWQGSGLPGRGVRDVDCVITSKEILMLAESRGIDFFRLPARISCNPSVLFPDPVLRDFLFRRRKPTAIPEAAGSSGGMLHHILQSKAAQIPGAEIQTIRGRNVDVVEYSVVADGQPVFRAARYYGFRNIQNLVRRLKPARPSRMPGGKPFGAARRPTAKSSSLEYSYVEVMACPGGCTNGGGQIKIDDPVVLERKGLTNKPGPQDQKAWLAQVDEAYFSGEEVSSSGEEDGGDVEMVDGISHRTVDHVLAHWASTVGIGLDKLAFTSFREVISDVGKDQITDTEKVVQLAGKIGGGW